MPSSATRSPTTPPRAAPCTGLAVITGTEDRPHAYVALTRGTDANLAYVFTVPETRRPVPGPRPAPELARYDKITTERAGQSLPPTQPAPPGTALGVLSAVLDNDGQQLSATQTRNQALADADHLAILHAIWTAETTPARNQHYRDLLINALPTGHRAEPGHQARWAVAHPARRRTGRAGPGPRPGRGHRRARPGRIARRSKPGNDSGPVHPGREGPTAIVAQMMMDASKSRRRRPRLLARIITGIR
jgi:hypothetical protein